MKGLLIITALLLPASFTKAQYKLLANECSNQYNVKVFVADCDQSTCNGKATLILSDKITGKEVETFHSPDLDFNLTAQQNPKLEWVALGKYQSPVVFGDFNFDGLEDLAIRNGSRGPYSSPSFDVYLASPKNKFTLNTELTKLASENMGMFDIDRKQKELTIHLKNGCCYQQSISYKINSKNALTESAAVIEDSTIGDDVTVITIKYIDGKMQKKVEKFKTKDYYTEN